MAEQSAGDFIGEVYAELKAMEGDGTITTEGAELLNTLDSGAWVPEEMGAYLHGLLFSGSDEALGWVRGKVASEPKEVAAQISSLDRAPEISPTDVATFQQRQALDTFREEDPIRAYGMEAAGALTPAFIPGMQPTSFARAATLGTAAGGLTGFLSGEGSAEERVPGAVLGSAIGIAAGLGGKAVERPLSAVGRTIGKAFGSTKRQGQKAARALLKEAITAEGHTMETALQYILDRAGRSYTLADIGPNTRAYLDAAAVLPGVAKARAQKFLADRAKGQLGRLTSDIQQAFGKRGRFLNEFSALKAARSVTGGKLYKRANARNIKLTPRLIEILKRPSIGEALARARRLAAEDGVELPKLDIVDGNLVATGVEGIKQAPVKAVQTKFLHYLKMGLDDQVYPTPGGGGSGIGATELRSIKGTLHELLDEIDAANPAYRVARNYWAGETASLEAMKLGRSILRGKLDPDELDEAISRMSGGELEAFRLGALNGMIEKIEDTVDTANVARSFVKTERLRKIMRATFPKTDAGSKKFDTFMRNLDAEMEMHSTYATVAFNSATATRQEAVRRLREAAELANPADIQSIAQVVHRILKSDFADMSEAHLRSMSDELSRILTETDPKKLELILAQIGNRRVQDVLRDVAPEIGSRVFRAALSPIAGGAAAGRVGAAGAETIEIPGFGAAR